MPGAGGARPRRYVVAGAGVLGVCLTARLAGAGAEVMLLEQDQPGQAATRSSFAWLNSNDKAPRAPGGAAGGTVQVPPLPLCRSAGRGTPRS